MNIMKKFLLLCPLALIIFLTACSGKNSGTDIVGTWLSEYDEIVVFDEDGTCSAPFTYNGSWLESANRYTIKEDGTLVLSSESGHAGGSYEKTDTEEEAIEEGYDTYYISKDILVIDGEKYTKSSVKNSGTDIVGKWLSEYDEIVVFEKDGTCSAPFTYNASWLESANRYAIKEDGTLVLSSESGHAGGSYEKTDTEEEAIEEGYDTYYISKNILVIDGEKYTKSK